MLVIKATAAISDQAEHPWLFLAGSIEMGKAEDWQHTVEEALKKTPGTIFNPRRDDWDATWTQRADNPQFFKQVTWELMAMHMADLVFFNFCDGTKSPITLLELGICSVAKPDRTVVRATSDFWRFGNIEILCLQTETAINIIHSIPEAIRYLQTRLGRKNDKSFVQGHGQTAKSRESDPQYPYSPTADPAKAG